MTVEEPDGTDVDSETWFSPDPYEDADTVVFEIKKGGGQDYHVTLYARDTETNSVSETRTVTAA